MYANKLIVLKFGGSVLRSRDDQFLAAQEVYRWYKSGYKVVAIVSALQGETDRLFDLASQMASEGSPYNVARLVSSGERESAALLGLVLDECGLPNSVLYEGEIDLRTCGDPLDATPQSIDVEAVKHSLAEKPVLIVPGFVGRDEVGRVNLLGRGGSDLTAILIANWLGADRCRLIKDVDGLYEFDPKADSGHSPARYQSVTWGTALTLDKSILQHKAIQFAEQNGLNFEVAACLGNDCTKVGEFETVIAPPASGPNAAQPVRVGLLGFGTVGSGVFEQLLRVPGKFQFVKIGVGDVKKHALAQSQPDIFTDNWSEVVESDCDVVVELIGGTETAKAAVTAALQSGKPVVTANKSLVARCWEELKQAKKSDVGVLYSAAVGGGTPMLETVDWMTQSGLEVRKILGILNGTTNFVLDLVANGTSFSQAIEQAQQKGLAEADPSGDLSGNDAAEKLVLLCRHAGVDLTVDRIETIGVDSQLLAKSPNQIFRQIASAAVDPHSGAVEARTVTADSDFANTRRQGNFLSIMTTHGSELKVLGSGAGRWPTTMSVVSDLFEMAWKMEKMRESTLTGKLRQ